MREEIFQLEIHDGEKIQVRDIAGVDRTITPQSQAFSVRLPNGGFVWNRPAAVLVEQGDQVERIPIVDVTLLGQIILWGATALFAMIAMGLTFRNMKKE